MEGIGQERKVFGALALFLFTIITISIVYLFTMSQDNVDLAFSYVAGISMIVLPCTLPLAFVIVPMSMGKGYKKGLNADERALVDEVESAGEITQDSLRLRLGWSKSKVSTIASYLDRQGILQRKKSGKTYILFVDKSLLERS